MADKGFKIEDIIPFGRKHAISRNSLRIITGWNDRCIRRAIEEARKRIPIINDGDGEGYYRPTEDDYQYALSHYSKEMHRQREILANNRQLKKWLIAAESKK